MSHHMRPHNPIPFISVSQTTSGDTHVCCSDYRKGSELSNEAWKLHKVLHSVKGTGWSAQSARVWSPVRPVSYHINSKAPLNLNSLGF